MQTTNHGDLNRPSYTRRVDDANLNQNLNQTTIHAKITLSTLGLASTVRATAKPALTLQVVVVVGTVEVAYKVLEGDVSKCRTTISVYEYPSHTRTVSRE